MESIFILNANTTDTLIAGALLSGTTTQTSRWVEISHRKNRRCQSECVMSTVRCVVDPLTSPLEIYFSFALLFSGCKLNPAWGSDIWNWSRHIFGFILKHQRMDCGKGCVPTITLSTVTLLSHSLLGSGQTLELTLSYVSPTAHEK